MDSLSQTLSDVESLLAASCAVRVAQLQASPRISVEIGVCFYWVFSGLVLAPSPPPVPAASLLLGVVALPGAF